MFLPVETGKLSINKFFLAVRVGHLVSISYSCSKSCKVTTVLVNFNCISKSCGKVDVINCLKEKIPVSVWLRRIRIKDNQRCVVLLEPVERLSAFVSFRADVSVFLMIKWDSSFWQFVCKLNVAKNWWIHHYLWTQSVCIALLELGTVWAAVHIFPTRLTLTFNKS